MLTATRDWQREQIKKAYGDLSYCTFSAVSQVSYQEPGLMAFAHYFLVAYATCGVEGRPYQVFYGARTQRTNGVISDVVDKPFLCVSFIGRVNPPKTWAALGDLSDEFPNVNCATPANTPLIATRFLGPASNAQPGRMVQGARKCRWVPMGLATTNPDGSYRDPPMARVCD